MVRGGLSSSAHPDRAYSVTSVQPTTSNVFINGLAVASTGDPYPGTHESGDNRHPSGNAIGKYEKVKINGKNIHLIGDPISCGSVAQSTPASRVFSGRG